MLPLHGWRAWLDATSIPETAEWWQEIVAAIRGSEAFAFLITPESVASPECARELEQAAAMGKRIVPVLLRQPDRVPDLLKPIQWVDCRQIDSPDDRATRLVDALNRNLDWLRQHTWLLRRANEWESRDRDRGSLLRGGDLAVAEAWLLHANQDSDPQPTPEQKVFLAASRKSTSRTQHRRFVAVACALVISIVLTTIALGLRQAELHQQRIAVAQQHIAVVQQHIARSRELAADAMSQLDVDPELSVILAKDAVMASLPATQTALDALRLALAESHVRGRLRITYTPNDLAVAPAGGPFAGSVAVAGVNGTVQLFDSETGKTEGGALFDTSGADVTSVAFDPTGELLLATMNTGDVGAARVWRSPTDKQPASIAVPASMGRLLAGAIGSDGSVLLGGVNGAVSVTSGRVRQLGDPDSRVTAVARSGDATALMFDSASGTGDALLISRTGRRDLRVGRNSVTALAFSHRGSLVATGRSDGSTTLWNVTGPNPAAVTTVGGHVGAVTAVGFSADDSMFATGGSDGTASVFDTGSGRQLLVLRGHSAPITSLAFGSGSASSPSTSLITGSKDHTARIWDISSGEHSVLSDFGLPVAQAAIGGDGSIAVAALQSGTAAVWRLGADPSQSQPTPTPITPAIGDLTGVALSPDLTDDGALAILIGDTIAAYRIQVPPGGSGFEVRRAPSSFEGDLPDHVDAAAFDATGRYLAMGGSQGTVVLIDLKTGTPPTSFDGRGRVSALAVASDGKVAIGGEHGNIAVWSGRRGDVAKSVDRLPGRVLALAFSPTDTNALAASTTNSRGEVYEAGSHAPPALLIGHLGNVEALSFDATGKRLATASDDGTIRVWTRSGRRFALVAAMSLHAGPANSVWFMGENDLFASTLLGHVATYECDLCARGTSTKDLLRLAALRITRKLDCNEKIVFLDSSACASATGG